MLTKRWKIRWYENEIAIKGIALFTKIDEMSEMLAQDYPQKQIIDKSRQIARLNTEITDLMNQGYEDGIEVSIEGCAELLKPWEK